MSILLSVKHDQFKVDGVFRISRGARTESHVVTATVKCGDHHGWGECVPYPRYGESVESVMDEIMAVAPDLKNGAGRQEIQTLMSAGAARNAVDCALWDLEAKETNKRVWQLLNLPAPEAITTAYTISLDDVAVMRQKALDNAHRPLLKLKLAGPEDLARVKAVREGAPMARLIVDANEGWSEKDYTNIMDQLVPLNVEAIEQPMPAGDDEALRQLPRPIPLIADESCHARDSLKDIIGKYDMINIKLDKTGGLTEALLLKEAAEGAGLDIMVGCMVGSSLAMAPAMVVAHDAQIADLDGPLLLAEDRDHPLDFNVSSMSLPNKGLWG